MNKFFVEKSFVVGSGFEILNPEDVHHIVHVLRLIAGSRILLSDGKNEYEGVIEDIGGEVVKGKITDLNRSFRERKVELSLIQGIPKAKKIEFIVEKAAELGVMKVFPAFMDRSIVKPTNKDDEKHDRLLKKALSACEQSKRNRVMRVGKLREFKDVILDIDADIKLIAYENEEGNTLKDVLSEYGNGNDACKAMSIALVIGPEGGITDSELSIASANGYKPVSLGGSILRTETAGLVAASMIFYEFDL